MGWQDIDTAPKDGTPILACCGQLKYIVAWGTGTKGKYTWNYHTGFGSPVPFHLTHWMPLPDSPSGV